MAAIIDIFIDSVLPFCIKNDNFTVMTVKYSLQNIVYYHRKQAKLSRIELADLAGVGKTVIYDLEKGKETIRWSNIMAILNALNLEIRFESPLMERYEKSIDKDA